MWSFSLIHFIPIAQSILTDLPSTFVCFEDTGGCSFHVVLENLIFSGIESLACVLLCWKFVGQLSKVQGSANGYSIADLPPTY